MTQPPSTVELHETAADWFLRRRNERWTPADEADFERWLAADPAHREAYTGLARTWDDFTHVPRPALAADAAPARSPQRAPVDAPPPRTGHRRPGPLARLFGAFPAPAVAAACAVLIIGGWFAWDNVPRYSAELATAHGQSGRLELPDGSNIVLNMDSRLQVRYYPRRREVLLAQGEAFFHVEPGPERPFTVLAGNSEVRVVGTAFNVRAAPPRLVVKVLEGKVEVRADKAARQNPVLLTARQGLVLDPDSYRYQTIEAAADTIGDWRGGQLVFRRTRLVEVAEALSRYLGRPVTLQGSGIADLRISGYAATQTPDAFLESLPDLLPVRVLRREDGSYLIAGR